VATDFIGMDTWGAALNNMCVPHSYEFASDTSRSCRRLIKKDFNPKRIWKDARNRGPKDSPKVQLYCLSPPCIDYSSEGKSKGSDCARGRLCDVGIRYIRRRRPKIFILENMVRFRILEKGKYYQRVMKKLAADGAYHLYARDLDTADHGIPHTRARHFVVGILKTARVHSFKWPKPVPCPTVSELLDPVDDGDEPLRLPPKGNLKKHKRQRRLVRSAIREARRNKIDVTRRALVVDIGCSFSRRKFGDETIKCLTAARGAQGGPWVTSRGRQTRIAEMFRLQGIRPHLYAGWERCCSVQRMGHMLGNAVSLNIAEKLVGRALFSAGLVSEVPQGDFLRNSDNVA